MPTYDYLCPNGHRFEVIHSVTADGPATCPICGASPVRKAFTAPTIHFKGTGWAKKDRSSASRSATRAAAASDGGSDSGSETARSDAGPSTDSGSDKGADAKHEPKASTDTKRAADKAAASGGDPKPKGSSDAGGSAAAD